MTATARSHGIVAPDAQQQQRFESIVATFGTGYHAGLDTKSNAELARTLNETELSLRGFAYEGAGMALVTREVLNPWRRSLLPPFIAGYGERYTYLLHVGAGWTFGWVPRAQRVFADLDPVLRWLAFDGMGFRDCFFTGLRRRGAVAAPSSTHDAYVRRAFDQGIGRCLWFSSGGRAKELSRWIAQFGPDRHADLWSGAGLAVVYAGEPSTDDVEAIRRAAEAHVPSLAQGAAFAAKALERGGQLAARHEAACLVLCGVGAREAARVTDEALVGLSFNGPRPAYEEWRLRIQRALNPAPTIVALPP